MIKLITENQQKYFVEIISNYLKNFPHEIPHFFKKAKLYVPSYVAINTIEDFNNQFVQVLNYFSEPGYWFLFHDNYLGKLNALRDNYLTYEKADNSKIVKIEERKLSLDYENFENRNIGLVEIEHYKNPKNPLLQTQETNRQVLFFDISTGLSIWKYFLDSFSSPDEYIQDFIDYHQNYRDEKLFTRLVLVSLHNPIQQFPLERIFQHMIQLLQQYKPQELNSFISQLNDILKEMNLFLQFNPEQSNFFIQNFDENSKSQEIIKKKISLDDIAPSINEMQEKLKKILHNDHRKEIFLSRLKELEQVYKNECYLSTIVLIGSLLEGIIKNYLIELEKSNYQFKDLPKDTKDNSKNKPILYLNFNETMSLLEKNKELLPNQIIKLSDTFRDFRNHIHIHHSESQESFFFSEDTCKIGFSVLKMLIDTIFTKVNLRNR
jgi:hypothetical protein